MIIVDLDKLHFPFTTARPEYAQGVQDLHKAILKCKIDAIPIETIKKEIERLKEDIKWAWYYGNTAIDKMEYLKMWLEIKLEEWEKENE